MTEELARWYAQGKAESKREGIALGKAEGMKDLLKTMLGNGASPQYLSEMTGLDIKDINKLQGSVSA